MLRHQLKGLILIKIKNKNKRGVINNNEEGEGINCQ